MTNQTADALRVHMPGAFARLGPELANAFVATSEGHGEHIEFAAFRPSGLLAQAILSGEHADVYVSANTLFMRRLQRAGRVRHWSTLARNRLCLVAVPRADARALADLARRGLTVVAPQAATDPCGRYVEELWRREGMLPDMLAKHSSGELVRSQGSGDLPAYLLDGRAEAGIFYLSEARQLEPSQVQTVELPPTQDMRERIRFVTAALTTRGEPFVRFLQGRQGREQLCAAGFLHLKGGKFDDGFDIHREQAPNRI